MQKNEKKKKEILKLRSFAPEVKKDEANLAVKLTIGNPKSACLHFYTAKIQPALALPFLPYSTLRFEQCFDSGCLLFFAFGS